jgi:ribonuclease HI
MYFDGSLMKTGAGAGLLFISPLGKHVRYVLRLHFPASNNVAEYEALVNGLRIAVELGVRCLHRFGVPNSIITDNGTQFTGKSSWTSVKTTTSMWTGPP